jgi:hypothetical protein
MLIDPLPVPLGLPFISQYFKYEKLDPLFLLLYHLTLCGYLTFLPPYTCFLTFLSCVRFLNPDSVSLLNWPYDGSGSFLIFF